MGTIEEIARALDLAEDDVRDHFRQSEALTIALTCPCRCHALIGPCDDSTSGRSKVGIQECDHCRLLA